jgi:hypothetical protein
MVASPGFMGYASVDGNSLMCTNFNVNVKQEALFYDHTCGKIEAPDYQNTLMRQGTKIVQGGLSFIFTDSSGDAGYTSACNGDDVSVSLNYGCTAGQRSYKECKISTYTFRASAGEYANGSIEVIGKAIDTTSAIAPSGSNRLITWDEISVSGYDGSGDIFSIEFTITNPCIPIYTQGTNITNALFPKAIRLGIQKLSGTIGVYASGGGNQYVSIEPTTLTIDCGGTTFKLKVLFLPTEIAGSVGPVIEQVRFVGADENAS